MYGQDLYQAVTMTELNEGTGKGYKKEVDVSNLCKCVCGVHMYNCCIPTLQYWLWCGYKACQFHESQCSWDQSTQALSSLLLSNSQRTALLDDVLQR